MTVFAQLAFVTAPAASPTTVLDLTGPTTNWLTVENFSLGVPAWTASALAVGGDYGEREVTFTLKILGSYTAAATAMQAVNRQLLQPTNWLMVTWQPANKPMFIRTYRTQQEAVAWRYASSGVWDLPVRLSCDPWLEGSPQTIGPVTITNNPATGTNPMWYTLPAILGDAPTPLKIDITPSNDWADNYPLMALAALDADPGSLTAPTGPYFWQANSFTLGTGATAVTGNAAFSGSNYVSVATTNTLATAAISGAAPSNVVPGTYKVLARVARGDISTTFQCAFGQLTNLSTYTYGTPVSMTRQASAAGITYATWMDMGQYTFPIGAGGLDPADIGTVGPPSIAFAIDVLSGTGAVFIDAFLLIPVDTSATLETQINVTQFAGAGITSARNGVWDGTRLPEQFRAYTSGVLAPLTPPRINGRFLRATPGATNIFHLVQQTKCDDNVNTGNNSDAVASTAAVTFTYLPRYLAIRPDTT